MLSYQIILTPSKNITLITYSNGIEAVIPNLTPEIVNMMAYHDGHHLYLYQNSHITAKISFTPEQVEFLNMDRRGRGVLLSLLKEPAIEMFRIILKRMKE